MTETMQRMPQSKPPVKRVHFEEVGSGRGFKLVEGENFLFV
jgi:hypothetical protein